MWTYVVHDSQRNCAKQESAVIREEQRDVSYFSTIEKKILVISDQIKALWRWSSENGQCSPLFAKSVVLLGNFNQWILL